MRLKILTDKKIAHKNGQLVVFQKSKKIKFNMKRVFIVKSNKNQIRGKHAHKKCTQLLNCPNGIVEIYCENRSGKKNKYILAKPEQYLIVPPLVWCTQIYKKNNSILLVICDKKFQERDYIRNYKIFKKLKKI